MLLGLSKGMESSTSTSGGGTNLVVCRLLHDHDAKLVGALAGPDSCHGGTVNGPP